MGSPDFFCAAHAGEPSRGRVRLTLHMGAFFSAIRYTVRQFRLSPVFTAAAVLTLALGIGGTTAIFTLIHELMLRSLPVGDPARLYRIGDGGILPSRAGGAKCPAPPARLPSTSMPPRRSAETQSLS